MNVRVGWSRAKESLAEARRVLGQPGVEPQISVRDPDAHGATLALGFVAETDERGWRRLREELNDIGE